MTPAPKQEAAAAPAPAPVAAPMPKETEPAVIPTPAPAPVEKPTRPQKAAEKPAPKRRPMEDIPRPTGRSLFSSDELLKALLLIIMNDPKLYILAEYGDIGKCLTQSVLHDAAAKPGLPSPPREMPCYAMVKKAAPDMTELTRTRSITMENAPRRRS